jgi:hypothetical protein
MKLNKIKQTSTEKLKKDIILSRYCFFITYFFLAIVAIKGDIILTLLLLFIMMSFDKWIDRNIIILEIRDNKRW